MELALDADQTMLAELVRGALARAVDPSVVRAAEPLGHAPAVWQQLVELGAPGLGVAEELGGGGAGLPLLVAAAEEIGRALTPAAILEHQVAARLLAAMSPGHPALPGVVEGSVPAAFAPRRARSGRAAMVPGGAVAELVLALDGQELVAVAAPPPADPPETHAHAPLADRDLTTGDRTVLATGDAADAAFARAGDEWRVLTAAALVGLAAAALDLAVAYVKERHQFGVPIGSFQAVQHGLASLPGPIDGGRLLVHEAAWALETGERSASGAAGPELASMAFCFAAEVARQASGRCVQYHGGYGYAEEGDAQLLHRRARAWPLVLGDPSRELRHLADLVLGPAGGR